jgi:flavin-dependent dehydrogenase
MQLASSQSGSLRDNDCVAIVGGGPAGSFFAIHLLREAKRLNRRLDVVIVEKRGLTDLAPTAFSAGDATSARAASPRG